MSTTDTGIGSEAITIALVLNGASVTANTDGLVDNETIGSSGNFLDGAQTMQQLLQFRFKFICNYGGFKAFIIYCLQLQNRY